MWPVLFQIGPLTFHTYGLLVGLGFLAGYGWLLREFKRRHWPGAVADSLFGVFIIGGLAGARLLYVVIEWSYYESHWLDIFKIWSGGLVYYGGLVGAITGGLVYLRGKSISPVSLADAAAPGLALGQAFGRLGCFSAGCCYGLPTSKPWGVIFTDPLSLAPLNIRIHPTQLYESALDLVIFGVLAIRNERLKPVKGSAAALYLCFYGLARFAVEMLRGDDRGGFWMALSPSQWLSIAGFLIGAVWFGAVSLRKDAVRQA